MKNLGRDDIYNRISRNIKEVCEVQVVTPESKLSTELGVDSLKIAELSIVFENEFGVSCFLPDLLNTESPYNLTVNSLVTFVEDRMRDAS